MSHCAVLPTLNLVLFNSNLLNYIAYVGMKQFYVDFKTIVINFPFQMNYNLNKTALKID